MPIEIKYHYRNLSCVIIGSYRKSLSQLFALREMLEDNDINVMSPVGTCSVNPGEEFVILNADPIKDPKLLQDSIFSKIRNSSFVVVGNYNGYLGTTSLFEMGYSIALGVPLLTVELVKDPNLAPYCRLLKDVFPQIDFNCIRDDLNEPCVKIG